MGGWSCSHQVGGLCELLGKACDPGMRGCTLYGKALFADPATPSNEAVARREESRKKKEAMNAEEMKRLVDMARRGF